MGLFRGCLAGIRGFRVYFVSESAPVELKVDECKPLVAGGCRGRRVDTDHGATVWRRHRQPGW